MKLLIPYDAIEAVLIEKGIYKPNKGKQGRPSIPSSVLVGALFLQSWYGLSDPMTEELIHDRISFRKFLDIKDEDTIPDDEVPLEGKQPYANFVRLLSRKT